MNKVVKYSLIGLVGASFLAGCGGNDPYVDEISSIVSKIESENGFEKGVNIVTKEEAISVIDFCGNQKDEDLKKKYSPDSETGEKIQKLEQWCFVIYSNYRNAWVKKYDINIDSIIKR
ncbi:MAG: hypothetical protein IKL52_02615 [Candidatus Gastranaerophilales bacterium]|nr:hypothetical protein [Candidatus Gastranaerophilales bacterium]